METRLTISNSGGAHKEEKSDNSVGHEDSCRRELASRDDELDSAKAEMSEVQEENSRLKMMLEKIETKYKSLQMRFTEISQQEAKSNSNPENIHETNEEPEFVSLRLGRSSSKPKKDEKPSICSKTKERVQFKDDLNLGLDYNSGRTKSDRVNLKSASPENSSEETRKDEQGEAQPPRKVSKTLRSEDDEISQPSTVKRARVSVRARCDTPTMNDGCQWRKYGQKISKGNPCPRAYYRCTVATACPVRKQVQRCAEDMSILITTYEGTHNHPLSITATAMASTTAAAASMLLSGSSTAQSNNGSSATTSQTANLHGLNANPPDTGRIKPFYLPTTPTPAFLTITLDLTSSGPSSHLNTFSSNFQSNPRFPSRNPNFSSSESNSISSIWSKGYSSFGNLVRPYQEHSYQPYIEKNHHVSSQQPLTDTLTKALTSDPSFRSVIAAAISSMVGASGATQLIHSGGESFDKSLKWGEVTEAVPSKPQALNGNGCAPSYLIQPSTSNSQSGNSIAFPQTPSPFSISRTTSTTVAEIREKAKF